ncbi:MAG: hypothetical protein ABEI86_03680 [Halobacteriaceae archaeon]
MRYEKGAIKYFFNTLLTVRGYVSFYIFGDGIWNSIEHFQLLIGLATSETPQEIPKTLITVYTPTGLAGWVLSAFVFPVVGGAVTTILWYLLTPQR